MLNYKKLISKILLCVKMTYHLKVVKISPDLKNHINVNIKSPLCSFCMFFLCV